MLKINTCKLKYALVLAIASSVSVNAYSLPDNLDAEIIAATDKAVGDASAKPDSILSGETLRNIYLKSNYGMAVVLSDKEFEKSNKLNLPTAPKDAKGNYFLQLGSPKKAVNLPLGGVNIPVNLESLYFRSKLAEIEMAETKVALASGKLAAKSISDPVYRIEIASVTSSYWWPGIENLSASQSTTSLNHGGDWVGAIAVSWGTPTSYNMTICGAPTTSYQTGIFDPNGVPLGYFNGSYAFGCQAGEIKATAGGAWGTYSDSVNFL